MPEVLFSTKQNATKNIQIIFNKLKFKQYFIFICFQSLFLFFKAALLFIEILFTKLHFGLMKKSKLKINCFQFNKCKFYTPLILHFCKNELWLWCLFKILFSCNVLIFIALSQPFLIHYLFNLLFKISFKTSVYFYWFSYFKDTLRKKIYI